jgi:hypothetical protein
MPNWCTNSIVITGEAPVIKQIADVITECKDKKGLLFEALIGRDFAGTEKEYEEGGWYNHNLDRFGTKWDVRIDEENGNGCDASIGDDNISLSLWTAWSPPSSFCEHLTAKYPVVIEMQFEEPGCDFFGKEKFEAGKMTAQEIYSYRDGAYKWEPELFWSEVESDLESMLEDAEDIDSFSVEDYIDEAGHDFLTEDDKKTIQVLIDTQRNYIKEMGTLDERIAKLKQD